MRYTITIDEKNTQAQSIINMLKALSINSDYLDIFEDETSTLNIDQKEELESRYRFVLQNPTAGKSLSEIEKSLKLK